MSLRAAQVNVGLVLDAGALMAVDQRSRTVGAALEVARRDEEFIRTSAGAMAEVWRDGSRQVNLGRLLSGIDVVALDNLAGRRIGELLYEQNSRCSRRSCRTARRAWRHALN
jgi:hypothetical protein